MTGLFARAPIEKDSGIEVVGEVLTLWESEEREEKYLSRNQLYLLNCFRLKDHYLVDYVIDTLRYSNIIRFINHQCEDANCTPYQVWDGRKVVVYTNRDIDGGL